MQKKIGYVQKCSIMPGLWSIYVGLAHALDIINIGDCQKNVQTQYALKEK